MTDNVDRCPICAEPFKPDDICATDIELLTVHAECLDGCEIVDLETGEPTDKPLTTYRYSEVMEPAPPETNTQAVGTALADALSERQRQLDAEGWIPQHDDQYRDNELIRAAICYLLGNAGNWPWSRKWWKPTDRRRDLIKASALIIAEIERLDRAALAATEGQPDGR